MCVCVRVRVCVCVCVRSNYLWLLLCMHILCVVLCKIPVLLCSTLYPCRYNRRYSLLNSAEGWYIMCNCDISGQTHLL